MPISVGSRNISKAPGIEIAYLCPIDVLVVFDIITYRIVNEGLDVNGVCF
jgi:hypothetical protein